MNVRVLNRTEWRMAMLTLLAVSGVVQAQDTARWSWQEPQAQVLPTGDLEWAPRAFEFKVGASVRYIDFESGNDAHDGLAPQTPWKHHPWDPEATDKAKACQGVHTYVFKQGVVYRGQMNAQESGTADDPIILTRDPSWGAGPAVICGSEAVTGWKKGADNPLIPEPQKVWYVDLPWAPRNVWMVGEDGAVTRIAPARTPNWTITDLDDIQSEWWTWKNPDKPFDNYATINGQRRHLAFDKDDINESKPQDYYEGAIVWTTKGWVMGSPFQARVLAVDRQNGSLVFPCQWGGEPSYKIIRGCRFYLEDKPHYLDSPGEFWFDKKGSGGRLYLRLPGDRDPNTVRIEVAKRIRMIESSGMSHVHIRGLTFRFTNIYWNLTAAPYWVSHESIDVEPGCVRLLGSGTGLQVTNCTFEHVHRGVRLKAVGRQDAIDQVVVSDNVFSEADAGGVELADSTTYGDVDPPMGRLYDVRVMRNKFDHIGIRPDLFGQGGALVVQYAQTAEVAGNIFERVCAQGIDVHGAKPSGAATDRPFTRILIHHNKVVDSLLNVDDFGGIETWQGGPACVYDNISGNPGGYRNWDHVLSPATEDRFGHAYYLDGAFKNYYFNNIAWGKSKGPAGKLANTSAFQEIISYQNTFFNNTIYNFVRGSRRQEPQAGRVKFLGNIWQSMGIKVFRDADPAQNKDAGNEAAAEARRNEYALDTDAYARNVFYDAGESFGVFEPAGRWHKTLASFRSALESYQPLAATVGVMAEQSPLRDPAAHDFRPSTDAAARGQGARVFVPWSLYETVSEWNFYPIPGDPTRILDEHWCMSPYYTGRDNYRKLPTYPLQGVNIALKDYHGGPLENWTTGALHFNGRDQYAVLANEDINRTVTMGGQRGTQERTVSDANLSNPQIHTSDFLIEAYFQTVPGQKDATVIQKMDDTGYALHVNEAGGVTLVAQAVGATASLASQGAVNDGQWHHVIAEADRKAGTFTIYLDGKRDADGPGFGRDASLANDADLYVGGTPQGHNLEGAIDFLRLARGTLADAKTTIEELYAWEFHGPFLYDFTGRERPADGGEAGAIDEDALSGAVATGDDSAGVPQRELVTSPLYLTGVRGKEPVEECFRERESLSTAEASPTYSTTFDGAEDPLSEGGKWSNNGLDWTRIRKQGGIAHGSQTGTNEGARRYDDSYAHLTGFPPDQEAWAQVHIAKPDPSCHQELEILLRWSSSAHNTTGYECFARCVNDGSSYLQVVRWEGPLGKFTYLADKRGADYGLKDGDVLKASIVGNVITVSVNGVEKARVKDDTWKTGNPGMGTFLSCAGGRGVGSNADFGFRNFTARGLGAHPGTNPGGAGPHPAIDYSAATAPSARSRDYHFEGTISRAVLENYLDRSVTMAYFLVTGKAEGNREYLYRDDDVRLIQNMGAKFIGRAIYRWNGESRLNDPNFWRDAKTLIDRVHAFDPDVIFQGCLFETISPDVNHVKIPAWVFTDFGLPVEDRPFSCEAMLNKDGKLVNHWGRASVPDVTRPETQLWFYYLAGSYLNLGCEALHLGQVGLLGMADPNLQAWSGLVAKIRAYAKTHARRKLVLLDAHVPTGGMIVDGVSLLDFNSFPMRIKAIPEKPREAELQIGHLDSLYQRSKGCIAPSGWSCQSLPYLVEFDNFGRSRTPNVADNKTIFVWGWDEISWFSLQPQEYRNRFLVYAYHWLQETDPNGHLQMPVSRMITCPNETQGSYRANTRSPGCPIGYSQEETIKQIWSNDSR